MNQADPQIAATRLKQRAAFTMIELVSSLVAASVLLAGLATAMHVTNRVLEDAATVNSRSEVIESVADRMAEDARYATMIHQTGQSIELTLPDRDGDGLAESVVYESSIDGLTRSHSLNPAVTLLATAPEIAMRIDGYTSPTETVGPEPVQLIGCTQAATTNRTWMLGIETPSGTRSGDLLVMITAGDDAYVIPYSGGWSPVKFYSVDDLYLAVLTRTATSTEAATQSVFTYGFTNSSIAVVMHCYSGGGNASFNDNVREDHGYAKPTTGTDMPRPLERSTVPEHAMNLQILAFEDAPLAAASSGIAGFSDAGVVVATHSGASKLTLAIANRNGKFASPVRSTPDLITPARWVQMGIQWWPQ